MGGDRTELGYVTDDNDAAVPSEKKLIVGCFDSDWNISTCEQKQQVLKERPHHMSCDCLYKQAHCKLNYLIPNVVKQLLIMFV